MYYNVNNSHYGARCKSRPRRLFEYALRAVVRAHARGEIRIGAHALPCEILDAFVARRWPTIHPTPRATASQWVYPHDLVDADDTIGRISTIAYSPSQYMYVDLVSVGATGYMVRALTREQDHRLNRILLNYAVRSVLTYVNVRACPYVD